MSKIKITATLENKDEKHIYQGKGIKQNNKIIYKENGIKTKITLDNIITIEREDDYYIKINLKKGINLKGTYITNYGTFEIKSLAQNIIREKNELKITYKLTINQKYVDTFTYKLKFTIDT